MLTVRSRGEPFVGRVFVKTVGGEGEDPTGPFGVQRSAQSPLAEVAWFVRGRTLYRRVLLILPDLGLDLRQPPAPGDPWSYTNSLHYDTTTPPELGFYGNYYENRYKDVKDNRFKGFDNNFDLSVRLDKPIASNPATWRYVPNTLADLTKRENRFAHQPWIDNVGAVTGFPFSPHIWFDTANALKPSDWRFLGLPTLRECSHFLWDAAGPLPNRRLRLSTRMERFPCSEQRIRCSSSTTRGIIRFPTRLLTRAIPATSLAASTRRRGPSGSIQLPTCRLRRCSWVRGWPRM